MEMLQLGIDCCCLDEAIGDFIQIGIYGITRTGFSVGSVPERL